MVVVCMAIVVVLNTPARDVEPLRYAVIRTALSENEWENELELNYMGATLALQKDGILNGVTYGFDPETLKVRWLVPKEIAWVSWQNKPQGSGSYTDQTHVLLHMAGGAWREVFRETHSLQGGSGRDSYYTKRCGFRYSAGDHNIVFYVKGKEIGIETYQSYSSSDKERRASFLPSELGYSEEVRYRYDNCPFGPPLIKTTIDLGRHQVAPVDLAGFLAGTPLPTKEVEETDPLARMYGSSSREEVLERLRLDQKRPVSGRVRLWGTARRLYRPQLPFDASFVPSGILSLDYSNVMIWGRVVKESQILAKSILLRGSEFGSDSDCFVWKQVLDVGECTDILSVSFLDGRHGWLLAGWTQEGPGELSLYSTDDSGQTWALVCRDVPKPTPMSWPTAMHFDDKSRGRISLRDVNDGTVTMLESCDGGMSWFVTGRLLTLATQSGTESGAVLDQAEWRLERTQDNCLVERRMTPEEKWRFVVSVPLGRN